MTRFPFPLDRGHKTSEEGVSCGACTTFCGTPVPASRLLALKAVAHAAEAKPDSVFIIADDLGSASRETELKKARVCSRSQLSPYSSSTFFPTSARRRAEVALFDPPAVIPICVAPDSRSHGM